MISENMSLNLGAIPADNNLAKRFATAPGAKASGAEAIKRTMA